MDPVGVSISRSICYANLLRKFADSEEKTSFFLLSRVLLRKTLEPTASAFIVRGANYKALKFTPTNCEDGDLPLIYGPI